MVNLPLESNTILCYYILLQNCFVLSDFLKFFVIVMDFRNHFFKFLIREIVYGIYSNGTQ